MPTRNENLEKILKNPTRETITVYDGKVEYPIGEMCVADSLPILPVDELSPKPIVAKETKDKLGRKQKITKGFFYGDWCNIVLETYYQGCLFNIYSLIPEITDVSVKNKSAIIVSFGDGTKEKAILHKDDTFSLEQGISICISKKLLSEMTEGRGNSAYNKLVRYGLKRYKECEKNKSEQKKKKEEAKKQKALREEKRKKKNEKKKEREINIRKEAYLRAMREMENSKSPERES